MASRAGRYDLKLLLDEMFDPAIAGQLRDRGFDVIAAAECKKLRGLTDTDLFDVAQPDGRAVVTENTRDFVEIHKRFMRYCRDHSGLILTTPRRFPRTSRGTGKIVRALSQLLEGKQQIWYSSSFVHWLGPIPVGRVLSRRLLTERDGADADSA